MKIQSLKSDNEVWWWTRTYDEPLFEVLSLMKFEVWSLMKSRWSLMMNKNSRSLKFEVWRRWTAVFVCVWYNETEAKGFVLYENINVKKLGAILIHVICCGQRGKLQQLSVLFAAVTRRTAVINLATCYLLRSKRKTVAINGFFFLILFPIYCCVYTKTAASDKQQIHFFPLVRVLVRI